MMSLRLSLLAAVLAFGACGYAAPAPQDDTGKVIETEILILGGGMTGVAAANSLYHDAGMRNILIVEARSVLGGRVQDSRIGNYTIEYGANWIQGLGNNPIWKMAQKYGVVNRYSNWESIDYFTKDGWEGDDGPLQHAVTRYEEEVFPAAAADAGRRKELGQPDLSMKAGLKLNGWNPLTPEERTAEFFAHDWEQAEPPIVSSFIGTAEAYNETFVESGNGTNNIVTDQVTGYKGVVLGHAAEIPNLNVMYNTVVTEIAYSATGVTVKTKTGLTIKAKKALCTFSLGVLQHDDVKFVPELPEWKREAIANFHMATYTKIFARFPTKFWNDTEFALYADPDERGFYAVWQTLDLPGFFPGSKILFATLTGEQAHHAEYQTDAEVQADYVQVLRDMYGAANVPEPIEFKFPRWNMDPLFRGTFTNWGAGVTVKQQEDMRVPVGGELDSEATLWFAGEHTSRKYFGYLHGAYWEGRLAASHIADCVLRQCVTGDITKKVRRQAVDFDAGDDAGAKKQRRRRMWT